MNDPFKTIDELTRLLEPAGDPVGQPPRQTMREFFNADAVPIKTRQPDLSTPLQQAGPPPVIYL